MKIADYESQYPGLAGEEVRLPKERGGPARDCHVVVAEREMMLVQLKSSQRQTVSIGPSRMCGEECRLNCATETVNQRQAIFLSRRCVAEHHPDKIFRRGQQLVIPSSGNNDSINEGTASR